MVDLASMLFGDFQESIVATFGETIGWVVGHGLIVGLIALIWYTWVGREHIRTQSGWGVPEIRDIATIIAVTMAQYIVYTSNLDYPDGPALAVAFSATKFARWSVNVLNRVGVLSPNGERPLAHCLIHGGLRRPPSTSKFIGVITSR